VASLASVPIPFSVWDGRPGFVPVHVGNINLDRAGERELLRHRDFDVHVQSIHDSGVETVTSVVLKARPAPDGPPVPESRIQLPASTIKPGSTVLILTAPTTKGMTTHGKVLSLTLDDGGGVRYRVAASDGDYRRVEEFQPCELKIKDVP